MLISLQPKLSDTRSQQIKTYPNSGLVIEKTSLLSGMFLLQPLVAWQFQMLVLLSSI